MGHSTSKVLMGSTGSSYKEVSNHIGVIEAGVAVRLKSDDTLSTALADGSLLGISLGKDLSDIGRTAICRKGIRVPIKLTAAFDPAIGGAVCIDDVTGLAKATGGGVTTTAGTWATGRVGGTGVAGGVVEGATSDTGTVGVAYADFPGGL